MTSKNSSTISCVDPNSNYAVAREAVKQTRPTLVFERVDPDNALFLRISPTLPGMNADFFDSYDVSRIAFVNDLERRITVRDVVHDAIYAAYEDVLKRLRKLKRKTDGPPEFFQEGNLFIVQEALARVFIRTEAAEMLSAEGSLSRKLVFLENFKVFYPERITGNPEYKRKVCRRLVANLGDSSGYPLAGVLREAVLSACRHLRRDILPYLLEVESPSPWQLYAGIVLAAGSIAPEDPSVQSLLERAAGDSHPGVRSAVPPALAGNDSSWARTGTPGSRPPSSQCYWKCPSGNGCAFPGASPMPLTV